MRRLWDGSSLPERDLQESRERPAEKKRKTKDGSSLTECVLQEGRERSVETKRKTNEFGHDYARIGGPVNKTTCHISETRIHNLLRTRIQYRRRRTRDYERADAILEKLRRFGVFVNDASKEWRADGVPFTPEEHSPTIKYGAKFARMSDCETMEEAIEEVYENLEKASPRDISAFWIVVPKLLNNHQLRGGQQLVEQLNSIFEKTMDRIKHFGPRDLAPTALAFAKIANSLGKSKQKDNRVSYQEFLRGVLGDRRADVFQSIAKTSRPFLKNFDARYLSNLAYAYALVEYVPEFDDGSTLFGHIAKRSVPLLENFQPQELSNLVWAFEKAEVSHPTLSAEAARHIVALDHLRTFKPQSLSNILVAYAKAVDPQPALFGKIANHVASLDCLGEFKPQELSSIAWAFAKAEVSHPRLFRKVGDHIASLSDLGAFKPQEISCTIWAFGKVWMFHPRLFEKVAIHVDSLHDLRAFRPQGLSNMVLSYAKAFEKTKVSHPYLFDKVANHIVSLGSLEEFSEQEISNIGGAFLKANMINPRLFDKLSSAAVQRQDEFTYQDIAKLLRWAK